MQISNIEVGKPDTSPSKPSHTPGVRMGNSPHGVRHEPGIKAMPDGSIWPSGRRSTGINPKHREPIDPRMPRLSPA
jgi:hypothetical protein